MVDTAESIRLSLNQQLNESKTDFNLEKKSKLRLKKLPKMPSAKTLVPKGVFNKGPIAYGLVPRPKKPEGFDLVDHKSPKQQLSRRSLMAMGDSGLSAEMDHSSVSLGSISSLDCDDSVESISIQDLMEDDEDAPILEEEKQVEYDSPTKSRPSLSASFVGKFGKKRQSGSSTTFQSSSSMRSFDFSVSSFKRRSDKQDSSFSEQEPVEARWVKEPVEARWVEDSPQRSESRPSLSSSSVVGRGGRREQFAASKTFQSPTSVNSFDCSASSVHSRTASNHSFRSPSLLSVDHQVQNGSMRNSMRRSVSNLRVVDHNGSMRRSVRSSHSHASDHNGSMRSNLHRSVSSLHGMDHNGSTRRSARSLDHNGSMRNNLRGSVTSMYVDHNGSRRNLQKFSSSCRDFGTQESTSEHGSRRNLQKFSSSCRNFGESTSDHIRLYNMRRDENDLQDQREITSSHSLTSPGRRKRRSHAVDLGQQQPSSKFDHSARQQNDTSDETPIVLSECRSWVFWTDDSEDAPWLRP